MNINLIGVPLYFGCDKQGVQKGPEVLRKAGIKQLLEQKHKVYDMGDVFVTDKCDKDPFKAGVNAKYINEIIEVNEGLAHNVYASLCSGSFPFVVGGDHSLAAGSLAGVSKYFKEDLAVIWIDAHGDINTFKSSPTGNVHGMPLAASMGVGEKPLTDIYFDGIKVKSNHVFIIGARDLDEGELDLIDELNLNVWTMDKIKSIGVEVMCKELKDRLNKINVNNVHLSFDIDSLDPEHIIGTGTPVEDGLSMEEGKVILEEIFNMGLVKSMDFVEFNPDLDDSNLTLDNCMKVIEEVGKLI